MSLQRFSWQRHFFTTPTDVFQVFLFSIQFRYRFIQQKHGHLLPSKLPPFVSSCLYMASITIWMEWVASSQQTFYEFVVQYCWKKKISLFQQVKMTLLTILENWLTLQLNGETLVFNWEFEAGGYPGRKPSRLPETNVAYLPAKELQYGAIWTANMGETGGSCQ